ncbi:aldehyde dehydrogenase family protein [Bergeyella zoohelcum]|uniref:aldehyde dehydrogenase family protein n=1 Tax=Bergeyella zoohelcum TaxID=1015 RepID=UPI002A9115AE|nr:aldehyde dehydrogenase family protein [Bergeyella zoohelcum]MDY6025850.1 aldehyde dehydrogenase family protein [Bergeyella zoohelcum]
MSSQYNFPLDIEASQSAYEAWRNVSFSERQQLLHRLAEILEKEKESHAHTITKEMHKPISQSIAEVEKCVSMIRYYAHIQNVLEVEKVPTEFSISEIHHEPLGVILGIMPWNFPYWQVFRFAVPTLLSGNGVILKHASICLESGNQIQKLFEKAGFPIHLFTHSELNYIQVEQLIAHPIIKAVSLTGSEAAGRKIAAWAGQNLKKCVLELGGNDAFIVLKDADIEKAAKAAALGRLQNTGQTCVASKRYIVEEAIAEQFVDALISEYSQYTPQDVYQTSTHLGKMARPDLADELEAQYRKALDHGAKIILPLVRLDASSFEPGLLLMNEENPVAQEELFGPLGMLFVVPNAEKAVQLANNTPYGLGNVVFTQNTEKAKAVAQRLESGGVAVNQIFRSDERMPFGGVKNSGYGTELSPYALFEFTHRKTILGN